ncbi:MAG: HIT family protein [Desulfovibrionales bacterium]
MDVLWAPWRIDYILGPKADSCVFCLPAEQDADEKTLVLYRGAHSFVIMNRFPYMSGHCMVAPIRHVQCLTELNSAERHEIMDLTTECIRILKDEFKPDGINAGLNLGEAAGAGIGEHLHFHQVPRWVGDVSFMAAIGSATVIPEHLKRVYARLRPYFQRL